MSLILVSEIVLKKLKLSDKTVIIKAFKIPNVINQIVYRYFRKSKARRSFEYATKLYQLKYKDPRTDSLS